MNNKTVFLGSLLILLSCIQVSADAPSSGIDFKSSETPHDLPSQLNQDSARAMRELEANGKNILSKRENGARPSFAKNFSIAQQFIADGQLNKAKTALDKLHNLNNQNDYEKSRIYLLDSLYFAKLGDPSQEEEALKNLIAIDSTKIDADVYLDAGIRLLGKQYNAKKFKEAFETLIAIKKVPNASTRLNQIEPQIQKIQDYAQYNLGVMQKVNADSSGTWSTKLSKPSFFLNNINGTVNSFDFDCDNNKSNIAYAGDNILNVSAEWGQCNVKINSSANATYNFVQF